MVRISPHCLRPSSNWQVMYRCPGLSSSPSLLFFSFINGGRSGMVVTVVEVIVALGLAPRHKRGPALTLYTPAGFTKVFISGASPLPRLLLFLLPSAVEGKSKLRLILENLFNLIVVTTYTHPTVVPYIWTRTPAYTHTRLFASTHIEPSIYVCVCMFSNIQHSTSHHVIRQCRSFCASPTHNQPGSSFYSLPAQVSAKHNNTPADICLS